MPEVSVIFLGISAAIVIVTIREGGDILSPGRIYGFIWSLAIGLTNLKLSTLQHDWSIGSWLLVILGPMSFMVGVLIVYLLNLDTELVPIEVMRHRIRKVRVHRAKLFRLIWISFVVYLFSYLVIYHVKGYIPMFSLKGAMARSAFSAFGVGVLIHSMPFILFFSVLFHIVVEGHRGEKMILKVIGAVSAITYLFILQRFQFILTGVLCFVLLYYMTHRVRAREILVFTAVLGIFFSWVSSLRTSQLIQTIIQAKAKMKYGQEYAIFTEPYMYVVMNLENLARSVERNEYFTFGYYTFDFLTALTGLKHWIQEYFGIEAMPYLTSAYNTYTAFWTYFRDFGTLGLILIPGALGIFISAWYYRMRTNPSIRNISVYGIMVFVMMISFFNSPFGFLWFVYILLAMFIILRLTFGPNSNPGDELPMPSSLKTV